MKLKLTVKVDLDKKYSYNQLAEVLRDLLCVFFIPLKGQKIKRELTIQDIYECDPDKDRRVVGTVTIKRK